MEKQEKNAYVKSGRILSSALKFAQKHVKVGFSLLELAEKTEKFIEGKGARPAFPVNISINNIAAHFSPSIDSTQVFSEKDVVKVDVGTHIDGYITDSAVTVDLSGEFGKMLESSKKALSEALSIAKTGQSIGKIGLAIEKEIKKHGFKPISNLSGHGIRQWEAHAGPSIPNTQSNDSRKLEDGNVYAIEPFATNGQGFVHEGVQAEIFGFDDKRPVRNLTARKILEFVEKEYQSLPFAERWVQKKLKLKEFERKVALRELLSKKCVHAYPVLKETDNSVVTQSETTILVEDGKITVLVE